MCDEKVKEITYTIEEQAKINEIAENVDISDELKILSFASNLQRLISHSSLMAMANIRENKLEPIENSLKKLVTEINNTIVTKRASIIDKLFKKDIIENSFREKLLKANESVNEIELEIKEQQYNIVKDMLTYAEMYKRNLKYYKQISMYIEAGNRILYDINKNIKENTGLSIEYPNCSDKELKRKITSFDNKIKDLEVSRIVSIQLATELKMMQNMNRDLAYKIQSTVLNTIPVWHNQVIVALGINEIRGAISSTTKISTNINNSLVLGCKQINKSTKKLHIDLTNNNFDNLQTSSENLIKTIKNMLYDIEDNKRKKLKNVKKIEKGEQR